MPTLVKVKQAVEADADVRGGTDELYRSRNIAEDLKRAKG